MEPASEVWQAQAFLQGSIADVIVASFPLPGWTATELLEEIQRLQPSAQVIVIDAGASTADAVRLARSGAYQVFGMDFDAEELVQQIELAAGDHRQRARELARKAGPEEPWRSFLVGDSQAMQNVAQIVQLIAGRRSTVLVTGQTGTGKEMFARALHMAGPRGNLPMVAINCSALPENLLEAELFGHVKGAFTGAVTHRTGRFEQAHNSTLFLDEVGDMPLELQAKLLRVLQEREFQRLGSSETIKVDVRVIAASNVDLVERVRQGQFREDLYYRLNVVPVTMPALRDRTQDIPMLAKHFVEKICRLERIAVKQISPETLRRLAQYSWPGNVRQLENSIEMAIALSGERTDLYPADFRLPSPMEGKVIPMRCAPAVAVPDDGLDFERTVNHIERSILEQALRKSGGNKQIAANMLRLKRTTLSAKLRSLDTATAC
jgi:DNA-binding NtrC family response regulator